MVTHKVPPVREPKKASSCARVHGLDADHGTNDAKMLFITSSKYKYEMFKELLGLPLQHMALELEEIQGSKEAITKDKLKKVSHLATESTFVLIEDTSVCMAGLNGFPGQYARAFFEMGMKKVVEIADKVGTECLYSTIAGLAYVKDGVPVTKLFDGSVTGDIRFIDGVEPRNFEDVFVAKEEELVKTPLLDGAKIGRYKIAKKIKEHLISMGAYDKLSEGCIRN